jgi:hypothetical protein
VSLYILDCQTGSRVSQFFLKKISFSNILKSELLKLAHKISTYCPHVRWVITLFSFSSTTKSSSRLPALAGDYGAKGLGKFMVALHGGHHGQK